MAAPVGCFTSARASRGRVWHVERHVRRLARDARLLGLGEVDAALARRLLDELAAPSRAGADLKVRLEAQRDPAGPPRLRGGASALDADPETWRAIVAPAAHAGASAISAAKTTDRSRYDAALAAAHAAAAHEALLFDSGGWLAEGARTNVVVVRDDGRAVTPPLARGGQAGVAREILLELAEISEADVSRDALAAAREVVAVNAVRGARAITSIDGRPVGDGEPGPWSARLRRALEERC